MKNLTFTDTVTLKTMKCGTCGMRFALPQTFYDSCYNEGGFWTCPLGHSRGWNKGNTPTELEKLEAKIAAKDNDLEYYRKRNNEIFEQKERVERQLAAQKGQVTKLKKRVAAGVCPCCNRTFQNLSRHMTAKHADFVGSGE